MSYVIPSDTHGANDTGHVSDHNNIADVLTALGNSWLPLLQAPSGAKAETFPRVLATGQQALSASGTLQVMAIGLHQNTLVSNITFVCHGTAAATQTHGWFCLLDSNLTVQAVSADQTTAGAGGLFGATSTAYTLAMTSPYNTTYTGLYYVGVMVAAGTLPQLDTAGSLSAAAVASLTPILCGTSSTGQTTPPALLSVQTAVTVASANTFYAYVS